MGVEIREIKNKEVWESFLLNSKEKTFLNSWNWGEFNKLMGNKIWRFGIYQISSLLALALIIKIKAKRGTFLFLPHGPNLIQTSEFEIPNENLKLIILEALIKKLKEIAKEEKVDFIKIGPIWERNEKNKKIFKEFGFRESPLHIHPELTWELNIEKPKDELLSGMRKTTRYLIKQAIKNKEIEIEEKNDLEGVEKFYGIYSSTAQRQSFSPFSLEYLKNEFLSFSLENQVSILLGKYRGEIVAGGFFIFWQKIGFYHHGASTQKYPKIPVSYLLLWKAIEKAKERGCQKFNFWGICDLSQKNHPWYGLSLFKVGFGGEKKEYLKTQDLPLTAKYWLNFLVEKLRKIKRRL